MIDKKQLATNFISALKASPLLFKGEQLNEQAIKSAIDEGLGEYGSFTIKSKFLSKKTPTSLYFSDYKFIVRYKDFNGADSFFAEKDDKGPVLFISDRNFGGKHIPSRYLKAVVVNIHSFAKGDIDKFALPTDWIKTRAAQALEKHAERLNMDFSRSIAKCIENKVNDLLGSKQITAWATSEGINWHLNGSFATNVDAYNVPQSDREIDDLALEIAEFASSFR